LFEDAAMPISGFSNRPASPLSGNAATDLGGTLQQQTADESEEEKRRRRMGLSPLAPGSQSVMSLFPGLNPLSTGMPGVRGGRGY
jgi:hypothetical protein